MQACCSDVPESEIEDSRVPSAITDNSIIEMLEAEVQSLRDQLEKAQTQTQLQVFQSNLHDTVEKQSTEIDELRKKLRNAINDVSNSEQELIRLRKVKAESLIRERRMEELLATLERTEVQLNQRTRQLEDVEALKIRHQEEKACWEAKIREKDKLVMDLQKKQDDLSRMIENRTSGPSRNEEETFQGFSGFRGNDNSSSFDFLGDMTSIDLNRMTKEMLMDEYGNLKKKLEKAVQELRAMKLEDGEMRHRKEKACWEARIKEKDQLILDLQTKVIENRTSRPSRLLGSSRTEDFIGFAKDSPSTFVSLSDLANVGLGKDINRMTKDALVDEYKNLKFHFEKAVQEIRAMKLEDVEALRMRIREKDQLILELQTRHSELTRLMENRTSRTSKLFGPSKSLESSRTQGEICQDFSSFRRKDNSSVSGSLGDLTNINLKQDLNRMTKETLMDEYEKLKSHFEKAVQKLRAMKLEEVEALKMKYQEERAKINEKDQLLLDLQNKYDDLTRLVESRTSGSDDSIYQDFNGLGGKDSCSTFGSLSDLTNIDLGQNLSRMTKESLMDEYENLKSRFEKAVQEIRAMKRELRASNMKYDDLELANITLKQDLKRVEKDTQAQNALMAARVQDLTQKLSGSEKQVRSLKSKLQDSREKRRSLSLKGRESFSINKEVEDKITELEAKILALEVDKLGSLTQRRLTKPAGKKPLGRRDRSSERAERTERTSPVEDRTSRRPRRKSLDSATSSEPMKVLIRLSSLESKVATISDSKSFALDSKSFPEAQQNLEDLRKSPCELPSNSSENYLTSSRMGSSDEANSATKRLLVLESTIGIARDKIQKCLTQLNSLKAQRSTSPKEGFAPLEESLEEANKALNSTISQAEVSVISTSAQSVIKSFEHLLRNKLTELSTKRQTLRESGKLNQQTSMHLLAEKLAYETVLIGRIREALTAPSVENVYSNRILQREIVETSHLLKGLKNKLLGSCSKKCATSKISEDYLTRVLTRKLIQVGFVTNNNRMSSTPQNVQESSVKPQEILQAASWIGNSQDASSSKAQDVQQEINRGLEYLLTKQREMNTLIQKYKSSKLEQLAHALAVETVHYATDTDCRLDKHTLDDLHVQEAWKIAQETVSTELIHSEISHVMLRCAQMYEHNICTNHSAFFTFFASERAALELWTDTVEEQLRLDMEKNISELATMYNHCLSKLRQQNTWRRRLEQERHVNAGKSRQLLADFADITAHKALIDARISALKARPFSSCSSNGQLLEVREKPQSVFVKNLIESDQFLSLMEDCGVFEEDPLLSSEFLYLFEQFSQKCLTETSPEDSQNVEVSQNPKTLEVSKFERMEVKCPLCESSQLGKVSEGLKGLEKQVEKLQALVRGSGSGRKEVGQVEVEVKNWKDVSLKCAEIQDKLCRVTSAVLNGTKGCAQCEQLRESLNRLSREHEQQVAVLRRDQERDLVSLRGELEHERASLVTRHETEQAQLKERARMLERRLGTLDSEYTQQLDNLRSAYRKTLSSGLEGGVQGEDNIRQRYQAEIEQLRVLCEKGLMAVENSHRRVVAELEDKHRREREQLRQEKEQALAEETQATLAALDAMRKAHESEVRREINKFKQDFIRKMQATHDIGALHKEHEAEMKEIKQEILSLSERYSVKCVESASLEEQLCTVNQQLAQAQQHIQQLDSRNKQLRAHLVSESQESELAEGTLPSLTYRQDRVSRRGSSGMDGCKPSNKINTIRNPQLSPLQN